MKRLSLGLTILLSAFMIASCSTGDSEQSSTPNATTALTTVASSEQSAGETSGSSTEDPSISVPTDDLEPDPDPTLTPAEGMNVMIYKEVGRMIKVRALKQEHEVLVNNAGMNGSEGRNQVHDDRPEHMYLGDESEFIFDIGHIERLGELYLWNYNEADQTSNGLREILVDTSSDGEFYEHEQSLVLNQARGSLEQEAHGLEDRDTVDFGGISGRYLRIRVVSNHGGAKNGLSELRLYRYRQENVEGNFLSLAPVEQFNNGRWSAEPADYQFVNGSGLDGLPSAAATHDNNPDHMFVDEARLIDMVVDLQGQYPIAEILLWNYNDPDDLDSGLKDFRLSVSNDMSRWQLLGQYELPKADGSAALAPSLAIDVANVHAHYVKIEIRDNYGGENVGLSEVAVRLGSGWYTDAAPDYTALLSNYDGWAGADGIYTVNLDGKDYDDARDPTDKQTFFIFSDTITGLVDGPTDKRSSVGFLNNTAAILKGDLPRPPMMDFIYSDSGEANIYPDPPIPATTAGKQIYYWLGDSFVQGDKLYVFALRIDSVPTLFGFEQVGVDLARYDLVDGEINFDSLTLIEDGAARLSDISNPQSKFYFGGAVFQNTVEAGALSPDGYIYIYGYNDLSNDGRQLIVARVLPDTLEDFDSWSYLDADGNWSDEVPQAFTLLQSDVAPELSVSEIRSGEHKGKYLVVWQNITVSPTIKGAIAATPYSVFEEDTVLFTHDTHLKIVGKANTTYNAKAHPALSGPGELIISYNINGGIDAFEYGDIYRPRFLRTAMVAVEED